MSVMPPVLSMPPALRPWQVSGQAGAVFAAQRDTAAVMQLRHDGEAVGLPGARGRVAAELGPPH